MQTVHRKSTGPRGLSPMRHRLYSFCIRDDAPVPGICSCSSCCRCQHMRLCMTRWKMQSATTMRRSLNTTRHPYERKQSVTTRNYAIAPRRAAWFFENIDIKRVAGSTRIFRKPFHEVVCNMYLRVCEDKIVWLFTAEILRTLLSFYIVARKENYINIFNYFNIITFALYITEYFPYCVSDAFFISFHCSVVEFRFSFTREIERVAGSISRLIRWDIRFFLSWKLA